MNDKTKKTLKKAGIIAGCVVGGAGLMYAGYLCGELLPMTKIGFYLMEPVKPGQVCALGVKKPFLPGCWGSSYGLDKETATALVKKVNAMLQEVK